ncbi:MAG: transglutaminase-like domain-containing protein [Pirellulaceae bacterium]|jgi:hypothetical protein|nr:transglutaminase-like domain-containing protein [Pirellulaceae bacterium]MDP7016271.1 transglutaminase-like domain-containing protein [Pirellulaceae bacterium]
MGLARQYHWEGRRLLLDSVVHRKRTMPVGRGTTYCSFDIRRWISPPGDEVMGAAWQQLSRAYRRYLQSVQRRRITDARARVVWKYVAERIPYEQDDGDFWQFPSETLQLGRGDCEDKAFLCASLLLAAGVPPNRVRVVIGALIGEDRDPGGHAWPMYQNTYGVWCILEPNLPRPPTAIRGRPAAPIVPKRSVAAHESVFMNAERFSSPRHVREAYLPLVCFNHESVWTIEPTADCVTPGRPLTPDWRTNPAFDEILSWGKRTAAATS